jgi:hypothetical protein
MVELWPLEAALYSKAIEHYSEREQEYLGTYRSDLDIERWL